MRDKRFSCCAPCGEEFLFTLAAVQSKGLLQSLQVLGHNQMALDLVADGAAALSRWMGSPWRWSGSAHSSTSYWNLFCFWAGNDFLGWASESVWRVVVTWPRFAQSASTTPEPWGPYYQKYINETSEKELKAIFIQYDQTLLGGSWSLCQWLQKVWGPWCSYLLPEILLISLSWSLEFTLIINSGFEIFKTKNSRAKLQKSDIMGIRYEEITHKKIRHSNGLKYMERSSNLLIIKEMRIKIIPINGKNFKIWQHTLLVKLWRNGTFIHCWWKCELL